MSAEGAVQLGAPLPVGPLEQDSHVGDGLNVGGEAGVGIPGAVGGADQSAALPGEPDERGQVDGELGAVRPAGVAPAVAQAARGAVAADDQTGKLVERNRVLLRDQPEQLDISLRNAVGALVSASPPPASLVPRESHSGQLLFLLL